jgi:cell division protein FtsN
MRKKNKKVSLAKKPFLVLSRRAIAGWLVVIFLICAWMFTIGVLVGRGTSPLKIDINELQKKLDAAMGELKRKEQGQTRVKPDPDQDPPGFDFYESLPQNPEHGEISEVPPVEKKPPQPKKSSMKRQTKTQKKIPEQAEAPPKKPAEKSKPQPTAPKSKAASGAKPYTIQVAAFRTAGEADKLVTELKQKGFSAYRAIGKVPGKGIWYRVRVGEFKNREVAKNTLEKLKAAGQEVMWVEK